MAKTEEKDEDEKKQIRTNSKINWLKKFSCGVVFKHYIHRSYFLCWWM